jgi:hypothetical protein
MTDKIDPALKDELRACLEAAIADKDTEKTVNKAIEDVTYRLQSSVECALKDELAPMLAGWVAEMAERAIDQILKGNEDQMRRYLGCEKRLADGSYIGWTGRDDCDYWGRKKEAHEWHPVIHGRMFEQGALELRKQVVNAHRELLVNERILDLEDQVKALVAQINKATAEKEEMWRRYQAVA